MKDKREFRQRFRENRKAKAAQDAQSGPRDRDEEDSGPLLIWGVHAVEAALDNPARNVLQLWATDNAALRLQEKIAKRDLQPERVTPRDLDQRLGADTVHQGLLMEVEPLPEMRLADMAETILARGPLVVLDQVTDPHNVGAILRSAAVFGSAGLVMTRRHSPPLTGVLAKAASGALELVPVALIQNLARSLEELKSAGVELIGLDDASSVLLEDVLLESARPNRPLALVLGAEGRGLRQLTAESCSRVCRIATDGQIASLNVSNAAAVALHLAALSRRRAR